MIDRQRVYPVNYFFLHHSTGPDFVNAEDIEVQDWYDQVGKARGYQNGALNSNHEHPSRPGKQTYAMAQFTLREYTKDGNKYGFRLTDLIKNPWANVAWAVGDWFYNQRSSSVEICGNYLNKTLPDKGLMCLADFLREIDQELNGALLVWLHQEVFATACPARIKEQRDRLVDMINNPDKWNKTLWPPAPPAPVITTKEETENLNVPFASITKESTTKPKGTSEITTAGVNGARLITYTVTYRDGHEAGRVIKSDVVTKQPVDQITTIGTYVEPPAPPKPEPSNDYSNWFVQFWLSVMEFIKNLITKKEK